MISSYSSPRVFSCLSFFSWHSHTVMTFHPMSSSSFFVRLSLSLLPYNLFCQYSTLDLGILAYLHPSWRCQKQPWTSTIVLYFGSTMSGCPGYLLSFFLKRRPLEWRYFLTSLAWCPCPLFLTSLRFSSLC